MERFRDGLGAAVRGSCRGWRCQSCGGLRVLLLSHPGAPGFRAPCPLPAVAVGDLRRRQRREPTRGTAPGHWPRPRSHAPARSSLGDSRPRRRPAPDRPGDDPSHARLCGRKACGSLRWRDEPPLRRRSGLLADGSDGGSSAPSREPADRALPLGARRTPCSARRWRRERTGTRRTRSRRALDRRACQGPSGEPGQGVDRGRRAPARGRSRGGVRAEHVSRQHRQDGELLRAEGCGASERQLARLTRLGDEVGGDKDARCPGRQSGIRCPRRSRFRFGHGEGPSVDRARALSRRNIRQGNLARSPRALPRIVGRRARRRRHAQRRPAADPPAVRRSKSRRSAGADGRGPGSSRPRHRARDMETNPGRGRVRQEMEPRPA